MSAFGLMAHLPRERFFEPFLLRVAQLNKGWGEHIDATSVRAAQLEGWPWLPIPKPIADAKPALFMAMPTGYQRHQLVPDVVVRSPGRFLLFIEAELSKEVEEEQLVQQFVVASLRAEGPERPLVLLLNGGRVRPPWVRVETKVLQPFVDREDMLAEVLPLDSYIEARLEFVARRHGEFSGRLRTSADARDAVGWMSWGHISELANEANGGNVSCATQRLLLSELVVLLHERGFDPPPKTDLSFGLGERSISESAMQWAERAVPARKRSGAPGLTWRDAVALQVGETALKWAQGALAVRTT